MIELLLLISFVIGYFAGKVHTMMHIRKLIYTFAQQQGIDIEQELKDIEELENKIPVTYNLLIEKHNDVLYVYDSLNDKFVCQGNNLQELANHIKNSMNIKQASVKFDNKLFLFKDGKFIETA